ncbi:MAG: cation transporting ATPase C-terminal domain-containing protein, partial [Patescibacteria group bacterium]
VDEEETRYPSRFDMKTFALSATILGLVSTSFDLIFFFTFSRYGESTLQTAWFMGSVLTELILIYSIRTNKVFYKAKSPSKLITILTVFAFITTMTLPFLGIKELGFIKPNIKLYGLIISITIGYFICTEIAKLLYYKLSNKNKTA